MKVKNRKGNKEKIRKKFCERLMKMMSFQMNEKFQLINTCM